MKNIEDQNSNQKIDLSIKPSLERVGKLLKEARQSKNISSKELSEILRMGEEQIIAIENGQEDLLPEKVFIKGMIRRISEKLGVEKKIEKEGVLEDTLLKSPPQHSNDSKKEIQHLLTIPKLLTLSGISLITLLIVVSMPKLITKYRYRIIPYDGSVISPSSKETSKN
ncbi:helix-turn-helix domain-containing protein [Prochlorococcus marinus]|uniref:HTH cro/C1-type domain-containing protein n=1 Tax=Prochlorococcus marinus (strain MIT 9211) TaxID=93059 RepID=A9BE80_PROM4|nr:helix-turn-helix domain-containing protein [Prochlorococcus marinus]ABX08390.1 conserved hypothetical protein [Prochlorococcus marinus str. MIT 9211]